ncbi:hypothetical protein, partial [Erythrobacter sp.]|uniref:hypothetical protein n=1 Tax=Erythrobacter sp. TaxID=1042 RepID=UPI003C7620A5
MRVTERGRSVLRHGRKRHGGPLGPVLGQSSVSVKDPDDDDRHTPLRMKVEFAIVLAVTVLGWIFL